MNYPTGCSHDENVYVIFFCQTLRLIISVKNCWSTDPVKKEQEK